MAFRRKVTPEMLGVIHSKDFQNGVMENLYNFAIDLMAAWPYIKIHIDLYVNTST